MIKKREQIWWQLNNKPDISRLQWKGNKVGDKIWEQVRDQVTGPVWVHIQDIKKNIWRSVLEIKEGDN